MEQSLDLPLEWPVDRIVKVFFPFPIAVVFPPPCMVRLFLTSPSDSLPAIEQKQKTSPLCEPFLMEGKLTLISPLCRTFHSVSFRLFFVLLGVSAFFQGMTFRAELYLFSPNRASFSWANSVDACFPFSNSTTLCCLKSFFSTWHAFFRDLPRRCDCRFFFFPPLFGRLFPFLGHLPPLLFCVCFFFFNPIAS